MIENIRLALLLFKEALAEGRLLELFRQQVFRHRLATPCIMDLTQLQLDKNSSNTDYQFIELKADEFYSKEWLFSVPSRRIKAYRNLKRGLRGFAVIKGSVVLGDVWCAMPNSGETIVRHPDLEMLGIVCKQNESYGLDMLISPKHRGKNLAVPLHHFLQSTLKSEGCTKIYGYYWNDNIPAMWMHRMLKFKELPQRKTTRFFFLKKSEWV